MANPWFRLWADMVNDPKWRTIARVSKQKIGDVIAVYVHMMTCASNATERGRTEGWCDEDVATALDIDTEQIAAIREAMQGRVLDGDYLTGWEKRQPLKEDDSAARAKAWREAQKAAKEQEQTPPNETERSRTQDTDKDTDKKKEKTKPAMPSALPDWVPLEAWNGYTEMRLKKRKSMTARAQELVIAELLKLKELGQDVAAVLDKSTLNGWTDVYPIEAKTAKTGGWWATPESKLAKAMEVGAGPARAGESDDAWTVRIRTCIDNGGKPPAPKPSPPAIALAAEPKRVEIPPELRAQRSGELKAALKTKTA